MRERTLIFGDEGRLVGTLTIPVTWESGGQRQVALLSNSGIVPRAGPSRMNVQLAARFAALGIASIRFDMSGLGDSGGAGSGLSATEQWVADTRAAMDLGQEELGARRFLMVGLCSGADIAYLTALEDPRLEAAVLWDLCCYPTPKARWRYYSMLMRSTGFWSSLPPRIVGAVTRRLQRATSSDGSAGTRPASGFYGRSEMPGRAEFVAKIAKLVDRRVALLFGYSGSALGWFNYREQFADMFADSGWLDRVEWDYLPHCDHLFTQRRSQQLFADWVENWIRARLLPGVRPSDDRMRPQVVQSRAS